ncbi:MAG: glycosyltransferase, partial [Methylosarcina sp.]
MINDPSPEEFQTRLPLISIVVAVYNGREVLQQCVDSIASQTYKNKELIVIDGGSKDGTVDLLMKNQDRIGYWLSEPDKGIYNAWNKALPKVRGEW